MVADKELLPTLPHYLGEEGVRRIKALVNKIWATAVNEKFRPALQGDVSRFGWRQATQTLTGTLFPPNGHYVLPRRPHFPAPSTRPSATGRPQVTGAVSGVTVDAAYS